MTASTAGEAPFAAGSALRGSRHLRRAWEDVLVPSPSSSVPSLQAEAAQLRSRLECAKAEVERKHAAWSKGMAQASPNRLEDAAQRHLAETAKLEVRGLQNQLEAARMEVYQLRSHMLRDASPESPGVRRELAELQRKLQDTTEAWATAEAKNSDLQQQLQGQPGSCSLEYLDQVVSRYEGRIKELSEQLQRKSDEVVGLKERITLQEVQIMQLQSEPPKNLANALEFEEQLSASHERRNTQLSEQLAAKRQEVAILKEHLQAKSEEVKTALERHKAAKEEPDMEKQLLSCEAQQGQLRRQLQEEQLAAQEAKNAEVRLAGQVEELSTCLQREKATSAASGKLLRSAQMDCQAMWVSMEERKEDGRRLALLQQRLGEMRQREEDMTSSWRQASAQAADLEVALELQHIAAANIVQEHELQRKSLETRSGELVAEVDEQRNKLREMHMRLAAVSSELEAEQATAEERSCEVEAASLRAHLLEEHSNISLQEVQQATKDAWLALEEESRSLSERLDLAEQFTEGYERRNSELAEQLTTKRKELASLKARMISKGLEHEEAIHSVEAEAQEAAAVAAVQLQTAEASAKKQQQELRQLRTSLDWQAQEQQAEACLRADLHQVQQVQAATRAQLRNEEHVAKQSQQQLQQMQHRLDSLLIEATSVTHVTDELATAHQEMQQSQDAAQEAMQEYHEVQEALRRVQEEQRSSAQQACCASESRDEALAKLATMSLELQASEARSLQLEGRLARQLRELDPTLGYDQRGVSIQHLSTSLVESVLAAGLTLEASLQMVEARVLATFSETSVCPRDNRPGACYVDCIHGPCNAGLATHLLSCSPEDTFGEIVGALEDHCRERNLHPSQTYVWHQSFCRNLHRPQLPLADHVLDYRSRGTRLGKVLVIASPWNKPDGLHLLQSLCEMWHALQLSESTSPRSETWQGGDVELLLPPRAAQKLRQDLMLGDHVIAAAWKSLQGNWLEDAMAEHDAPQLWDALGCGLNLFKADRSFTRQLQRWLAVTVEKHLRAMLTELQAERAARLFDACGWMLWECGLRDLAGEMLRDGLQLMLSSVFPGKACAKSRMEINKAMTNLEVFQLAGSIFERAGEQDTPSVATLLTHMGVAKSEAEPQQTQQALEALMQAQRIRKITGTLETVAGAVLCWNIGSTLEQLGDFERAFEAYEAAQILRRGTGTLDSPQSLRLHRAQLNLARLYGRHVDRSPCVEDRKQEATPQSIWERVCTPSTSLRSETPTNQFL